MNSQEAKERVDRIKLLGRLLFGGLSALVVILTVLKVGTDNDWVFLGDFGRPIGEAHWDQWREIAAAVAAGVAGAAAISFSVRYIAIRNVLNQLFQDNSTHIGSQDNSTNHQHNYRSDPGVRDEVLRVGEHVRGLERLLEDRQADPEHLRQLREFLEYAQNERMLELKQQLAKDAEMFERFRSLMSQLASESETAAVQAQNILVRRR